VVAAAVVAAVAAAVEAAADDDRTWCSNMMWHFSAVSITASVSIALRTMEATRPMSG